MQEYPYRFSLRAYFDRVAGILDDVKAKYPKLPNTVEYLSKNDPSGRNKYLAKMMEWVVDKVGLDSSATSAQSILQEMAIEEGETPEEVSHIVELINQYHKAVNKLPKEFRDVRQMTLEDLTQVLEKHDDVARQKTYQKQKAHLTDALNAGAEVILQGPDENDPEWVLFYIPNQEIAYAFGNDLKWCISREASEYWVTYKSYGDMFYGFIQLYKSESRGIYQVAGKDRNQHGTSYKAGQAYYWNEANTVSEPKADSAVPVQEIVATAISHSAANPEVKTSNKPDRNHLAVALLPLKPFRSIHRFDTDFVKVIDTLDGPVDFDNFFDVSGAVEDILLELSGSSYNRDVLWGLYAHGFSVYLLRLNTYERYRIEEHLGRILPILDREDPAADFDSPASLFPRESFKFVDSRDPDDHIGLYVAVPLDAQASDWYSGTTYADILEDGRYSYSHDTGVSYRSFMRMKKKNGGSIIVSRKDSWLYAELQEQGVDVARIYTLDTIESCADALYLSEVYMSEDHFDDESVSYDQLYVSPQFFEEINAQPRREDEQGPEQESFPQNNMQPQDTTQGTRQIGP
jgi:hypothetical protein